MAINPNISTPEIPEQGPHTSAVEAQVDIGGSELRPVAATDAQAQPVSSQALLQQVHAILVAVLFAAAQPPGQAAPVGAAAGPSPSPTPTPPGPQPPAPPGAGPGPGASVSDQLIWAVRMLVQLLLMYLGTPPSITMLKHSTNSALLLPAIGDILKYAGAIDDTDNRIFRKISQQALVQQRDMLVLLRELWKMFTVAAASIEAGITHIEQFLDANARFVYTKLVADLGGDRLLLQDLVNLVKLVSTSIEAGLDTKKTNQRASAGAETGQETGGAQAGGTTAQPGGATGGVNLTVSTQPPATPPSAGQPVTVASTGHKHATQAAGAAAGKKGTKKAKTPPQGPKTKR